MPDENTDYIDATDYKKLESKITNLNDVSFDLTSKSLSSRKLRYAIIDIEAERTAGRIAPDEIYVPQHIIDTNIRREQSSYIQYITQSPRAIILKDLDDASFDLSQLEEDLTEKLRFPNWQQPMYANIDGFQANGYGIMETIQDLNNPGEVGREYVQLGDFSFIADTRDLQKTEMVARSYYFTKTKLKTLMTNGGESERWSSVQVEKLISAEPNDEQSNVYSGTTTVNRSLYKVMKVMFKVKGIVQVGWACPKLCDDWLRAPRPLYLGRRKLPIAPKTSSPLAAKLASLVGLGQKTTPQEASTEEYETQYPYFLYPYLISENDTIASLKGRVFLDQDTQSAVSSLLSSTLTQARRASGLYFSKDTTDPNDDFLMQKNVYFKTGSLINGKIKEFKIDAPNSTMFGAINLLQSMNQQETSQINYAETNRQGDSRKTATAIKAATAQSQQLSSVQVTLFSIANKAQYTYECAIIKSRVLAGLITVSDVLKTMYARNWSVKPSGDTDVIERQQIIQTMQSAWPIMQNTPAAQAFLSDLLEKMFPDDAQKYIAIFQQSAQQQQSQQAQQQQALMQQVKALADGVTQLSKSPEMFSETGRIHALPVLQQAAQQIEQVVSQQTNQQAPKQ